MWNKHLYLCTGVCIFLLGLAGCQTKIHTEKELYAWLNAPKNGFVRSKTVNGLRLTVKYLPPEYQVLQEVKNMQSANKPLLDSLLAMYAKNHAFLLTIAPDKDNGGNGDIMYREVYNYSEYKARVLDMNFEMGKYITLKAGGRTFSPVLSTLENTYSLTEKRNIYLVFAGEKSQKELLNAPRLDLIFADELFHTGINHFVFKKENIQNLPLGNLKDIL